ncbi:MAG: MbnP family protein [Saprospiraceae bacterium]|nr:MbnP family protein [Saprospiraceae bacterium]
MKHIFRFMIAVLLLVVLSACKDDEGSLTVAFTATYGTEPLVMFDIHDYAFDQRVQFTRLEFFISNLGLIRRDGTVYKLSDLELIDLTFTDRGAAETGVELTYRGVPAGTYESVQFALGVDPVLNATVPADYSSDHPLSETGRYWHAWNSYIFSKSEGNLDTLNDGTDNPDLGFAYHTGTDDFYLPIATGFPISIPDGAGEKITFRLNYEALFGVSVGDLIDIQAKPQNHNPLDTLEINKILDNYLGALSFIIE